MWVLTVFEQNTYRCFEYETKEDAVNALQTYGQQAILSFTK
mgnify:CR=1 FL=1